MSPATIPHLRPTDEPPSVLLDDDRKAAIGKEHADTFRHVQHPDLRADYVLANPPFNDSDTARRGSPFLQSEAKMHVVSEAKDNFRKDNDVRWQFGVPPKGNANFAWVQHFYRNTNITALEKRSFYHGKN